jgi:hypothetical protein
LAGKEEPLPSHRADHGQAAAGLEPGSRAAVDDGMSFSPWHGIAAHRPLGSIMRVRKMAYEMGRRFRAEKSGRSIG